MGRGARDLIAKLSMAVPAELRPVVLDAKLKAISFAPIVPDGFNLGLVRQAIRLHRKLEIGYRDSQYAASRRTIWPVAIAYTEQLRMIAGWCELRGDFRHFRADRVASCAISDQPIPQPARQLRTRWERSRSCRNASTIE